MNKILDVSNSKILNGEGIQYFSNEICNLYRPCGNNECEQDGYSIVFSGDSNINQTKFFPILIKEWFYLVEKDGYLIIKYIPNNTLNPLMIEDEFWLQWKGKYNIISHKVNYFQSFEKDDLINYLNTLEIDYLSNNDIGFDNFNNKDLLKKEWILVIKKNKSTIIEGDNINKWTIGIITNGNRNDWIEELINSIKNQNIPEYEVIVCGNYEINRNESNFKYIPFNKRNNLGWITKKKNLIIQNAKYQNIAIMHDRYVLDDNWFNGMKKWGNNFEFLTCKQIIKGSNVKFQGIWEDTFLNNYSINKDILRYGYLHFLMTGGIDDNFFSKFLVFNGGFVIFKKNISNFFDESLFWKNYEDHDLSIRNNNNGIYLRNNIYSIVFTQNYSNLSLKEYNGIIREYDIKKGYRYKNLTILKYLYFNFFLILHKFNFIKYLVKIKSLFK